MKVLVIGSGAREHALAWKIRQSARVTNIFVAPGNAGTSRVAENVPIKTNEIQNLLDFACKNQINLTVVGPDDALAAGIVDSFQQAGLRIFGPMREAAKIEWSKSFAKEFMLKHRIPTARFARFESSSEAKAALQSFGLPVVVKADGLALGKGVVIACNLPEAHAAIEGMLDRGNFGRAGRTIIIEEFLTGTECSLHVLVDGKSYLLFPTAQDHKQLYDGNQGPNTGGMGAFSPSTKVNESQWEKIHQLIIEPTVRGLAAERIPFRGLLFPGIILTKEGPKVLEYNARFGDPETQVLLPRLKTDLVELLEATIDQRLDLVRAEWDSQAAVCVVLASAGYPGHYETGKPILGLRQAESIGNVMVFHAGTRLEKNQVVTAGGRVLGVTAVSDSLFEAKRKAYDAVDQIEFDNCYFRHDIAAD